MKTLTLQLEEASFNPHSRMGSDIDIQTYVIYYYVSIHTPAWGVTETQENLAKTALVSIHTPAWGVTKSGEVVLRDLSVFQSTLPHGE